MLILQSHPPLTRGLIAGLIYAGVVLVCGLLDNASMTSEFGMRVIFAFAAGLAFQQVVDGAALTRGVRSLLNPHLWMFGYVMGATWGAVMMLAFWDSEESPERVVFVWGFAALIFGAMLAIWPDNATENTAQVAVHYNNDQPQFARSPFFRWMYFAWPFVSWALIIGMVTSGAEPGVEPSFIWYMMIFFIAINAAYFPKGGWRKKVMSPLAIGLLIMVAVLLIS